ncbi:uncharacterized protein LOC105697417 [Orussus abietinus]|uniref:uncharacterized protein LOC105697417 n=1 Tax=Orussus abietinus TaxID=222816 RepID=UPI000625305D|nr:uncharacterized protein LOC105697417 [Orussus abietinus]XP_012276141.1 uncharacterized protein LOC105697417 [Orussus abietinus]
METNGYFPKCSLSENALQMLSSIRDAMRSNNFPGSENWEEITGECLDTPEDMEIEECVSEDGNRTSSQNSVNDISQLQDILATQNFFTKNDRPDNNLVALQGVLEVTDITESLYEVLENNGRFDFSSIESISTDEVSAVVQNLKPRLSPNGIYNLARSICSMDIDQRIKYIGPFCTNLLLPNIITPERPSRLIYSAISECIEVFPDDMKKLILHPLLNVDVKDTTAIDSIVNCFTQVQWPDLTSNFLLIVKDLKQWHIAILHTLTSTNLEESMKDKLLTLLQIKALQFSTDKNYGKCLLNFLKNNKSFTAQQQDLLKEIVAVNETVFKKPLENMIKNMSTY